MQFSFTIQAHFCTHQNGKLLQAKYLVKYPFQFCDGRSQSIIAVVECYKHFRKVKLTFQIPQ